MRVEGWGRPAAFDFCSYFGASKVYGAVNRSRDVVRML